MSLHLRWVLLPILLLSFTQVYAKTPTQAIQFIANYAQSGTSLPLVSDYEDVGVISVGTHNIAGINAKISEHTYVEVDTRVEIQVIVDEYNQMIMSAMIIITNHILSDEIILVVAPTLTMDVPTTTIENNVTVEVNGEEGQKVYVNGVEVGIIGLEGKVIITILLTNGVNSVSITLKNNLGNESQALVFEIISYYELIINEISSAYYNNDDRWFEIYNPTAVDIDISDYTLKSRYYDGSAYGIFEFVFPSKTILPGAYLIVKSNYGPAYNKTLLDVENAQVMYLKDTASNKYPLWYSDEKGFLEILKDGKTIDFVTIGYEYESTSADAWTGTYIPIFTTSSTEFWKSIARDIYSSDTNTLSDWQVREFPTYAGLNDVVCNDDMDEDGIPDCSEVNGSTYAGMDLYAFGARTNQKDIFIEVDYVDSTNDGALAVDEGIIPHQKALEKVKFAFATNGYSVHFDVGDLYAQNGAELNSSLMDLGGGNEVTYTQSVNLGCTNAGVNAREYKTDNMQTQRKLIFYYMLFGTSQNSDGSSGSSGCAELPGNDSLVTLGGWGLSTTSVSNTNELINFQAGTVMHEFGHNLGLSHGGDENENYKPNYLSVMNYLYQLEGLSTIGDNEGDRYYNNKGCDTDPLTNPYDGDTDNFIINYSNGIGTTLDEVNGVVESAGLGYINSVPVDYNCNDVLDDILTNYNVNTNWDNTLDTVSDHNDWDVINIVFSRTDSGNSGITKISTYNNTIKINPISNDIQPVAEEFPMRRPIRTK